LADLDTNAIIAELQKLAKDSTLQSFGGNLANVANQTQASSDTFNKEAGSAGKAFGIAGNIAGDAGMSLLKFGNTVFSSQARISDGAKVFQDLTGSLGKNVPGMFGKVGKGLGAVTDGAAHLIKAAESGVDTFRTLSGSGAAFNNDILEMKNSAAQSRLSLDEFAGIVSSNTQGFAAFGGTVTSGAQKFVAASKQMFDEGTATPLLNLGMTFEEVNEDLAEFMIRNRRAYTEEQMRDGTAAKAMVAMSTEMDKIAKITGMNRKELEKETNDRMRKGQVDAKIRQLEASGNKEAAQKMKLALAEAAKAGPGALAAVEDIFTKGTVVSEEGRQAAVALGPAFHDLTAMVNTAKGPGGIDGMRSSIGNFNSAIAARVQDPNFLQIATLGGMGNATADAAAGMLMSAGTYSDSVKALQEKEGLTREAAIAKLRTMATEEQKARDPVTSTVINGEKALRDLGAVINDDLIGQNGAIRKFSAGLEGLAGNLEGMKRSEMEIFGPLKDALGTGGAPASTNNPANTSITQDQADKLAGAIDSIAGGNAKAGTALATALSSVGEKELQLKILENIQKQANDQGITLDQAIKNLTDQAGDITAIGTLVKKSAMETGSNSTQATNMAMIVKESGLKATDLPTALSAAKMTVEEMTVLNANIPPKAAGGPVNANSLYMVGEKGPELFSSKEAGNIINNDDFYAMLEQLSGAAQKAAGGKNVAGMINSVSSSISGAMNNVKSDQGPQQMQASFGGLAASLEKMGADFEKSFKASGGQDMMKDFSEQLNTTMGSMTGELMKGNKVASKQLKSLGGLSGNLFKG
tara:strand:+ start:2631 stop:5057 length:2427 start_codon:yes stop_codon:yes gene_type:complete